MNTDNKLLALAVFIGFLVLSCSIFYHAQHDNFEIMGSTTGLYRIDKSTGEIDACFSNQTRNDNNIHVEIFCDGWLAH